MTIATERRSGLGRGLGELFQRTDVPAAEPASSTSSADASRSSRCRPAPRTPTCRSTSIVPNPRQPRSVFDGDALDELVDSIREVGLLQPVVVRPLGDDTYELVMGERRWRASQLAGTGTIPAIVRPTEDHDLLRDALLENLHRAQLNPLEEAAAYQQLLEDFGCTQDELASRIKRSRPQISNTIRLLKLPPTVQRRVAAGVLSAGHARALLALPDPLGQERLAQRVVAEGLSVRATEELVTLGERDQPAAPTKRGPREPSERARVLVESLTDRLDTRVRVDAGRTRGQDRHRVRVGGRPRADRCPPRGPHSIA